MSFRTGLPFTVHATTDTSGTGENTGRGDQIGNAYAGVSHSLVSHSYGPEAYFLIAAEPRSQHWGEPESQSGAQLAHRTGHILTLR